MTTIRPARETDAEAVLAIFNAAIERGDANTESHPKDLAFMRAWLAEHDERFPVFVALRDAAVAGYASLNRYFPHRRAYENTAEVSYYVSPQAQGQGVGSALLGSLIAHARSHGFHKCVVRTFATNEASLRLVRRYGFELVGVFHEDALVRGEWRDVAALELLLVGGP